MLMWKDVLHAGFTMALTVRLFDLAADPAAYLRSKGRMAALAGSAFLFCVWRNNGLYAFFAFCPVLVWFARGQRKRALALCALVAVCVAAYRGPVFRLAGVAESPAAEMLSIPAQQIARAVRDHSDALTEEDKAVIAEILPLDELAELYHPRIADRVKNRLNSEAFSRQPMRYAGLWARLLTRFPGAYAAAFLCSNYGYWYPDAEQWVITLGGILQGPENVFGLRTQPLLPVFQDMRQQVDVEMRDVQGLRLLFSIALMIWLEAVAAAVCVLKRRRDLLLPFALLALWWCTVLLSPLSAEYRYGYALVLSGPACVAAATSAKPRRPARPPSPL
jgi:hypothetical protein